MNDQQESIIALMPPVAKTLVRLIGFEAAIILMRAEKGQYIRLVNGHTPEAKTKRAYYEELVGEANYKKMLEHFRYTPIWVPLLSQVFRAHTNAQIIADCDAGMSLRDLVRKYEIDARRVYRITKQVPRVKLEHERQANAQIDLFSSQE